MGLSNSEPKVRDVFQILASQYSFFYCEIEKPLYAMKEHIESMESGLLEKLKENVKGEDDRLKYEEENYQKDDITGPEPRYYDNIEVINLHYISIFIFLYSFLERKMKKLSDSTERKYKKKKDESYLFEFKMNLQLSGINFQKMETEWNLLNGKYRDLRNDLVHDDIVLQIESPILNNRILIDFMENTRIFLCKIYYEDFEN